ncbi:MAG TPA: glycerophosphodiester phosphodiesterase [Frankiaceae bacterium]|nr:glycerophosphodiester phosphodiesterase [Frankiaceae bacterium]
MHVLGHRGSRRPGPENTPEAVRAALEAGADGVEVDVRRSRDGQLICLHDPALNGTGSGRLGNTDLRRVVVESDAATLPVALLDDVLDAGRGGRVVLEVKNVRRQPDYDGRRATSARLLTTLLNRRRAAGADDDVIVSSFDPTAIIVARAAGLPTALLTLPSIPVTAGLRVVLRAGHAELHAHTSALPARMPRRVAAAVTRVHDAGVRLVVWTVTSTDDALRLRDAGVDAVICDDPAAVRKTLDRHEAQG